MSTRTFDELLAKIQDKLVHCSLRRVPIPPIERLMVTLRYKNNACAETGMVMGARSTGVTV
ncbi:unnamed protein product [Leptidea sinapis]|uniref:Uncharacterized protein n=1 Tax=Leptidea sinapis TaxID=189913 RepID=A0A5E4Q464_9NEOP|nr:unnamed protein product [Leptidea sinapis]